MQNICTFITCQAVGQASSLQNEEKDFYRVNPLLYHISSEYKLVIREEILQVFVFIRSMDTSGYEW